MGGIMNLAGPNPRAIAPGMCGEEGTRRIHCVHYNRCLDWAVDHRWADFSCRGCNAYSAVLNDLEYWRAEAGGCAELLYEVYKVVE